MTADLLVKLPENAVAVDVTASFRVGNLTYVELGSGEKVSLSAEDKTEELHRGKFAGATSYTGQLACYQRGAHFRAEARRGQHVGAELYRCASRTCSPLPAVGWREAVPAQGCPGHLRVWAGADAHLERTVHPDRQPGDRARPFLDDSRPWMILAASPASAGISSCQVELLLSRHTTGKLDGAFKDGSVVAVAQSIHSGGLSALRTSVGLLLVTFLVLSRPVNG